jgi:hypothetical protein
MYRSAVGRWEHFDDGISPVLLNTLVDHEDDIDGPLVAEATFTGA